MNKKVFAIIALVAATQVQADQGGEFQTGNQLYARLGADDGTFKMGTGYGFVMGVHDSLNGTLFCSPETVNLGQVIDITKQYLVQNPSRRHMPGSFLVSVALAKAFPCPKK